MMFKLGLSAQQRKERRSELLKPQPWKRMFAWYPVHLDDNVWIWWEYFEYRDVYKANNYDGTITSDKYEVRSVSRGIGV